jgi:cell division protein FtsW (lipid II flippase)
MPGMGLLAIALYLAVIFACFAAVAAARQADRRGDALHWLACAAVFAGLIAMRLINAEERLRGSAREWVRQSGNYAQRGELQLPLALLIGVIGVAVAAQFVRQWRRERPFSRARLVLAARFALLGLVPLFGLRLVSLHAVDQVLYHGPLRLNWLAEGAICLAVGGCAAFYARRKRGRMR